MRVFSVILLFGILFSTLAHAESFQDLRQRLIDRSKSHLDPYKDEYSELKPSVRFPEPLYQDERYLLVDNLRDLGEKGKEGIDAPVWKSALIDTHKVKRVVWMMCVFVIKAGPIKYNAGHAQMVFEFEEGGAILADRELQGIVNSFEIIPGKGVGYDPIGKGMSRYYNNSCTLSSKQYSFLASASRDARIELYTLDLTREEMVELLKISLREALDKESIKKNKYHTTRNSCVTNQFRILNLFLPKEIRIPEWTKIFGLKIKRTFGTIVPRRVGKTLKKHGLVKNEEIYQCPDEAMQYIKTMSQQSIFQELYN